MIIRSVAVLGAYRTWGQTDRSRAADARFGPINRSDGIAALVAVEEAVQTWPR